MIYIAMKIIFTSLMLVMSYLLYSANIMYQINICFASKKSCKYCGGYSSNDTNIVSDDVTSCL